MQIAKIYITKQIVHLPRGPGDIDAKGHSDRWLTLCSNWVNSPPVPKINSKGHRASFGQVTSLFTTYKLLLKTKFLI